MAKKKNVNHSQYSSFWFDEDDYSLDNWGIDADDDISDEELKRESALQIRKTERMVELIKLGAFMRSAKNFVGILTGRQDIIVRYEDGDNSYTDGKAVTLSSKVEGNFDSTIGLALHEASHIVKTDFHLLRDLFGDSKFRRKLISNEMIEKVIKLNPKIENWAWRNEIGGHVDFQSSASDAHKAADVFLTLQFKDILNWIEDRRIDNWVYSTAPGYRGYYDALYNRYFYSDEVSKDLEKNETFKEETFDSYMYRLINLLNPKNDLDSLKELRNIKREIDVAHISRLTSTQEVMELSQQILQRIVDAVEGMNFVENKSKKFQLGNGTMSEGDGVTIDIDSLTDEQCKEMFGVSKNKLKKLLKEFQGQRNFVRGEVDKKKLSRTEAKQMNALQESGVTLELAGGEEFDGRQTRVILLNKLTDEIVNSDEFYGVFSSHDEYQKRMQDVIDKGFALGKMLGRRLQVRNEERTLKYTRQDSGKIDKRLVHSLGYDVENVFSKVDVNRYNKAHIHISVDASGSMSGSNIQNATKMSIAIAVACKMNSNLECVISFRTTRENLPLVYVAYDSRKDGLAHIRKYFPYIDATGTTPESLCFEAMMRKVFPMVGRDSQFFFVNLSDGEPYFHDSREGFRYGGEGAYQHCKRMINKMRQEKGATIISYFITGWSSDGKPSHAFCEMYGATNSFLVDSDSVVQIAHVMNKKFLENSGTNKIETSI